MDNERLRKIVEALLNDNGRTPEEAEAARRKAAQLMMDAGVSEAELLQDEPDLLRQTLEASRMEWLVTQYTMVAIARLSGCRTYYDVVWHPKTFKRTDRKKVHYVGYRPDVENAEWLYSHILEEAKRSLAASGITERRKKDDFMAAFGARLARRMNELADTMEVVREEQQVADGHSLVVARDAAIDDYMKRALNLSLVSGGYRGRGHGSKDAIDAGREAAGSVSLGRPVGSGGPAALPSS